MRAPPFETMAQRFQALSDPTRLQLLHRLRHGERCVCDLMDVLDAAQSRLSFHLRILKEAGLVSDRREGRWVYYRVVPAALDEIQEYVEDLAPRYRTLPMAKAGCCD